MDLRINNKVFIVTGGASGIGGGITKEIAREGGIPVFVDRDKERGREMEEELLNYSKNFLFIPGNLTDETIFETAVERVFLKYGRIDGLVNNAGVNDGVGFSASISDFKNSVNKNLVHFFGMAKFCLPYLKENRGSILNISSKVALAGQGGTSGYAASKGAQLGLTREWAAELAQFGVRVNAIVPAEVMTPQYKEWFKTLKNAQSKMSDIQKLIPLENRFTTIQEIADFAVYILSERAGHITGQYFSVDGGYLHLDRALN